MQKTQTRTDTHTHRRRGTDTSTDIQAQRRQSGLKSGGRGSGSKAFRFVQANFRKLSIFRQFHEGIRISRQKLAIYSYFWANYYYFSSKVTIFEHTCRPYFLYMIRYNNISRPVHDPLLK